MIPLFRLQPAKPWHITGRAVGPFPAARQRGVTAPVRNPPAGYPCCVNRSLLAGPEGHPFHPLLVPLPIGAFVSSLIFDILTRTRADGLPYLVDGAFWLIGTGLISGLLAAVSGLLDLRRIARRAPAFATARTHLTLNAAAFVCSRSATPGGRVIMWSWTRPGGASWH